MNSISSKGPKDHSALYNVSLSFQKNLGVFLQGAIHSEYLCEDKNLEVFEDDRPNISRKAACIFYPKLETTKFSREFTEERFIKRLPNRQKERKDRETDRKQEYRGRHIKRRDKRAD